MRKREEERSEEWREKCGRQRKRSEVKKKRGREKRRVEGKV